MKLKENFITHTIGGQHFLLQVDSSSTLLQLNETAAFIVEQLKENVSENEIVCRILDNYGISDTVAKPAVSRVIAQLLEYDALQP